VNATGPWTDSVRQLDDPAAAPMLRLTKGAHIAVPQARLGNRGAVTLTSPIDGRVMFVLPWGDVSVVGTTDTDCVEGPDDVAPDAADVTYLLRSANAVFPGARLQLGDVLAAWAALRPLLASAAGETGAVPREHRIEESAGGLVTIAGGKLTTYRRMAAEVVDVVARRLRALDGRRPGRRAATDVEPLPGGDVADLDALTRELLQEKLTEPTARHLARTYGSEAGAVVALARNDASLARPLIDGGPWMRAEVVHQARREMALTVGDVALRRLHLFHLLRDQGQSVANDVASLLGRELRWTPDQVAASVADYGAVVTRMRRSLAPAP
jgi:glycerol-3-phosphate dehydrogenase